MRISQYLFRRSPGGNYYFRLRTPQALKHHFNTREIKRSLKTTNYAEAKKRALPYLAILARISSFSDIEEIFQDMSKFPASFAGFQAYGLKPGGIDKLVADPKIEGDVEAAMEFADKFLNGNQGEDVHNSSISNIQISLQGLMDRYIQDRVSSGRWSDKSKGEYIQAYQLLTQIIGEDISLSKINSDLALKVKQTLLLLPPNINKIKKYKNKSIVQIMAMADTPRSIATVNKQLGRLSSLFKWGTQRDYVAKNYFEGLTVNDTRDEKELRDPFSDGQLEQLFAVLNDYKQIHSYYYWLPRIGLFTGMRLNEICQLHLSDIKQEEGIYVFDINDNEEKRLKNKSSKRYTPIHSKLIEMGLLERVNELKKRGEMRLFPELKFNGHNYADQPSKWFTRVREKLSWVNLTPMLDFHSLRHTVITQLQEKNVAEFRAAALVGQKVGDGETYKRYGKGFAGETMKADIELLEFYVKGI